MNVWSNSSEIEMTNSQGRNKWKSNPENRGRCWNKKWFAKKYKSQFLAGGVCPELEV